MGVNANISESLTGTIEAPFPEFEAPPANPMEVLRNWLERARRYGVREPRALALATVDGQGRPSTRIVVIAELGERGVVFATHADSQKGRELAQNPWASGVLYYCLFELCLESVEFWGNGTERLHERLRYDRDEGGWKHRYLQP
ncbi:pyridoxamine 5'-phosphate oxidase family protein [Pseudomonas aeruginosa]|uniref:pyridoxine 5'-phosphate oxidase C-terminal domain-containing protein n=1 Tax=Pseudomonas aeruginosa TaxID=287 RepID=UPI00177F77E1|nr:pyridoxamine 5'-phosphate oxidase family protein [Pseudomonas aeruginosa]